MRLPGALDRSAPLDAGLLRELARPWHLMSLVRIPLAAIAIAIREHPIPLSVVIAIACASDLLDGWLARRAGSRSPLGAWLDPICDKVFVLAVVVAVWASRDLPAWIALLALAREAALAIGIALLAIAGCREHEWTARPSGKATTVAQIAVVSAALAGEIRIAALAAVAAAILGAIAALEYALRARCRPRAA